MAEGAFGRIFYAEGDYVHDMDLGFYDAYQYSGGENWKAHRQLPAHALPDPLRRRGARRHRPAHAVSVSCIGVRDERGDGVFDKEVSMFGNDFSNATALFELADGGVHADQRDAPGRLPVPPARVPVPLLRHGGQLRAARHGQRLAGQARRDRHLASSSRPGATHVADDPSLADVAPALRDAFISGMAPVHDAGRLPAEFRGLPNGHEGSHHFLVDDFVTAVNTGTLPPVNAWEAARYTLPGIVAHESALRGGERLPVPDFGDAPAELPRPALREPPVNTPIAWLPCRTRPHKPSPVTRNDVARLAGVSTAVVSYVVNGGPKGRFPGERGQGAARPSGRWATGPTRQPGHLP